MATLGAKINHPSYGEGVIFNQDGNFWRVYFQEHGEKEFNKSFDDWELVEEGMEEGAVDLSDLTSAVEQVFEEHYGQLVGVFRYYASHYKSGVNKDDRNAFQMSQAGFMHLCVDALPLRRLRV